MASQRVPRTRNAGTQTEAAFWAWLRAGFRRMSMGWKPKREALKRQWDGVSYIGRARAYMCAVCGRAFKEKDLEADHIVPCGSLRSWADTGGFLERLFVEADGWQWVCHECHQVKTQQEKQA